MALIVARVMPYTLDARVVVRNENHRQRRLLSLEGITERLAKAILFVFTGKAPNPHQNPDRCSLQSDYRDRQVQDHDCAIYGKDATCAVSLRNLIRQIDTAAVCYNEASGCPCFVVRAALLGWAIARALSLAIAFSFLALSRCCGYESDYLLHQACHSARKLDNLNNQIHRQLTSSLARRRCQHAGLTPLTSTYYTSNYIREFYRYNSKTKYFKANQTVNKINQRTSKKIEYRKAA